MVTLFFLLIALVVLGIAAARWEADSSVGILQSWWNDAEHLE